MTTKDRVAQAMTRFSGDILKNVIKKATTRVENAPKRKHIKCLIMYMNNPRAQLVHVVDIFGERLRKPCWVVSIKSILSIHWIFNANIDSFQKHIASRVSIFALDGFIDRSSLLSVEMSSYVTAYAKFLETKMNMYRQLGRDLTINPKENTQFEIKNYININKELDLLISMSDSLVKNKINFTTLSPLLCVVQTYLFNEFLRVYSCINIRIVFLIQNLDELEAIEAAHVYEIYKKYYEIHKEVQKVITAGNNRGVEQARNLNLIEPPIEIIAWLETVVRDIVHARGSRRLQREWSISDSNQQTQQIASRNTPTNIATLRFDPDDSCMAFDPLYGNSITSLPDIESLTLIPSQGESLSSPKQITSTPFWGDPPASQKYGDQNYQNVFSRDPLAVETNNNLTPIAEHQTTYQSASKATIGCSNDIDDLLNMNLKYSTGIDNVAPFKWDNQLSSKKTFDGMSSKPTNPFS